jgi:hypothetical protein
MSLLRVGRIASRGGPGDLGRERGWQFSRCACGSTPAFGRVEPTHDAKSAPWMGHPAV